jgi:hypothetical protein
MASEIRTRFITYMTLQGFSPHTKKSYLDGVTGLARFYNKSPDTLTNEEIQEYFRYLLEERKVTVGTCPCRPGISRKNFPVFSARRKCNDYFQQSSTSSTGYC